MGRIIFSGGGGGGGGGWDGKVGRFETHIKVLQMRSFYTTKMVRPQKKLAPLPYMAFLKGKANGLGVLMCCRRKRKCIQS